MGDGVYNNPAIYGPWCATAGTGGNCPGPICMWSASLLTHGAKRVSHEHTFLGTHLMQVEALVGPPLVSSRNIVGLLFLVMLHDATSPICWRDSLGPCKQAADRTSVPKKQR